MKSILDIGLTNALIASLLAVVAVVAGRFRIRPALRHGLWLLVLLKLIAPPLWPVHLQVPARTVPESVVEQFDEFETWTEVSTDQIVEPEPPGWRGLRVRPWPRGDHAPPIGATGVPLGPATPRVSWRMIVSIVWLGGSIVWLSLALIRITRFRRVLRNATPADETLREHVHDVAARIGLRRIPRTVMTSGAVSPLVWGFAIVPKLVIPTALWARLDHGQRTTLLIHELAHLRRGDHLVRWLELVVMALYWWHPAVWLARRAVREAEEQCCDAWVVWAEPGSARSYATALLETVEFLSQSPGRPFAATGLGRVDHLKRRLTMILRGATPRGLSWSGGLTILGLAGVLLPLSPIAAQEEAKEEPHATVTIEADAATPFLTGEHSDRTIRLRSQQDTWPPDVVPTLPGEVAIQEAAPATKEPEANAETTDDEKALAARREEYYNKLRSELSQVEMERIEAEVELRVAEAHLKRIKQQVDHAAEPTADQLDAAKVAEESVENLKLRLQRYRLTEAKTESELKSLAAFLRQIEYNRAHAGEIEKAIAEVSDARKRLDEAILRQAEAQGLKKPGPAKVTTTSRTQVRFKDGSTFNTAVFGFDVQPVSKPKTVLKVSPIGELGPDGRPADGLKADRIITTDSMIVINKDGSRTVYEAVEGEQGGKPKLQIRTLGRTDGEPNIMSPEEQSLREQEAEARKALEAASRMVRRPQSDPAVKHHKAKLAEIQARLRAIRAADSNPNQRIDAVPVDTIPDHDARLQARRQQIESRSPEEIQLRARILDIEQRSRGRYDYPNDPAYKHLKAQLDALVAPRPNSGERIEALERKLNDVLDELKQLKPNVDR